MVNVDFRTYRNTFWIIFGTAKKSTKYRSLGPLFLTETLQGIQQMETFRKNIIGVNLEP